MAEFDGMVWIVERDLKPLIVDGRVVSFPCGGKGTNAVRAYLNQFPKSSEDTEHYYDAVIYRSPAALKSEGR
jgi:hypothetical protein